MKLLKRWILGVVLACGTLWAGVSTVGNLGPAASLGRVFYVIADANCVQADYDPNQIQFAYDPNQIVGHLLGVVECTAGLKVNQEGDWCDPEGDPVTITLKSRPAWVSMTVNPELQSFTLAGMAPMPGVYYVTLELVDAPVGGSAATRTATIVFHAHSRPNMAPSVRLLKSL